MERGSHVRKPLFWILVACSAGRLAVVGDFERRFGITREWCLDTSEISVEKREGKLRRDFPCSLWGHSGALGERGHQRNQEARVRERGMHGACDADSIPDLRSV